VNPPEKKTEPLHAPEVVSYLDLMAAQLEGALHESEPPVTAISGVIGELAAQIPTLEQQIPGIAPRLRAAIVALQFYDRLSQRLTHVRDGVMLLAGALQNPGDGNAAWAGLHDRVRKQYSMEQERRIFELAAAGAAPEEFSKALATHSAESETDRVELF